MLFRYKVWESDQGSLSNVDVVVDVVGDGDVVLLQSFREWSGLLVGCWCWCWCWWWCCFVTKFESVIRAPCLMLMLMLMLLVMVMLFRYKVWGSDQGSLSDVDVDVDVDVVGDGDVVSLQSLREWSGLLVSPHSSCISSHWGRWRRGSQQYSQLLKILNNIYFQILVNYKRKN